MPAAVQLQTLRANVLDRADKPANTLVPDAEANNYINKAHRRIHRVLAGMAGGREQFTIFSQFNTVAGTDIYSFATVTGATDNILYINGIDAEYEGNTFRPVLPYTFIQRNRSQDRLGWGFYDRARYALVGRNIRFIPSPNAVHSVRVWYIPEPSLMVTDTDTLIDYFGLDEYVELDAAIQILSKEESDISTLLALREDIKSQILSDATTIDAGLPKTVQDVEHLNHDHLLWQ